MAKTPAEIYGDLLEGLRNSSVLYHAGSQPGDKLSASILSVTEVIRFLEADSTIRAEGLTKPLGALAFAAGEILQGGRPALLFDAGVSANRPLSLSRDMLKVIAMMAIDILGHAGYTMSEASDLVSKELQNLGHHTSAKDLRSWRNNWGRASRDAHDLRERQNNHPFIREPVADRGEALKRVRELMTVHVNSGA